MKYLQYRKTYKAIQRIKNYAFRVAALKSQPVEFQEFYIALGNRRMDRVGKLIEFIRPRL